MRKRISASAQIALCVQFPYIDLTYNECRWVYFPVPLIDG